MLELEVILRNEAEVIWAYIFEGADPTGNLVKAADNLVFGDFQMSLGVKRVKVALNAIDLEVLCLLKLL